MAQKYPSTDRAWYRITAAIPATEGEPIRLVLTAAIPGNQQPIALPFTVGEAYDLGRELLGAAQGVLAGVKRPWDEDPDRVPFHSRPRRGGATRSGTPRGRADRGPAGGSIRPTSGPGSAR